VSQLQTSQNFRRAVELLKKSHKAVALTGAGISTPSGIPDFRSQGSGLWERFDPMEVASLASFRHHPEKFYAWIKPLAELILEAEPNPAHMALARLEKAGILAGVVTQNIDDLHQQSGSIVVHQIHGHLRTATCVSCYQQHSTDSLLPEFSRTGEMPRCLSCGGILKPDAVLFGEQLPNDVVRKAENLIRGSDLVLIAGSSLEVTPAAHLPIHALNAGAALIIINRDPTYLDKRASAVFRQDVALILPRLVDEVLGE
jgi:NAD-dependent deacetylase